MRKYLSILLLPLITGGCFRPPAENALAGKSETSVQASFGKPASQFSGHYGLPSLKFTRQFTGEIKTEVFTKSAGSEYVSFEKRNGVWIAICNSWLPKGAEF